MRRCQQNSYISSLEAVSSATHGVEHKATQPQCATDSPSPALTICHQSCPRRSAFFPCFGPRESDAPPWTWAAPCNRHQLRWLWPLSCKCPTSFCVTQAETTSRSYLQLDLTGPAQCYSLRCVSKGGENTDSGSITAHADHRHHVHAGENGHTYIWMAKETHQYTSEVTCSTCSPRLDDKAMSSKTVWQVQKIIESRCLNSQDMTRAGPLPAPS